MKGRGLLLIFAVGCITLFAAFAIGYANEGVGEFAHQAYLPMVSGVSLTFPHPG